MSKNSELCDAYWVKLLGQAKVALIGASDVELKVQLFETLQEFFDGSNCWQEAIRLTVIPDTLDYPIKSPCGRILRLNAVLDQYAVPQQALMPSIDTVRFLYPYTQTQPMTALVVKTVTDPFTCFPPNIPVWVLPLHGLGLKHGLIGSMMLQPGTSYSNPEMANFHLQKFKDAISHARVAATKMNTIGAQNWMFPQSFRSFGQKGGVSTFNVHPTPR
jgi:hypothetical protein